MLCEHNEKGSFGFVLNHYVDIDIYDVIPELPEIDARVSVGGPVSTGNIYYLHCAGEEIPGSVQVIDSVYMGGDFEVLKEKISIGTLRAEDIRFFVGYSGWSPNQLDDELEQKSWMVSETSEQEVMNTTIDKLWKQTLERQGKKYKLMSTFPENFRLN